jgi:hypothetical protein
VVKPTRAGADATHVSRDGGGTCSPFFPFPRSLAVFPAGSRSPFFPPAPAPGRLNHARGNASPAMATEIRASPTPKRRLGDASRVVFVIH